MKKEKNKRAFTLIELLVVVLIIGILSAIALPQYTFAVEKSRLSEALTNAASLQKAIDVWVLENGYPKEQTCFLGDNCGATGQLAIDLESGMDCDNGDSEWGECYGKNFNYFASCASGNEYNCYIVICKNPNEDYCLYWYDKNSSWYKGECAYPDDSRVGEKICNHLSSQGFYPCENC